VQDCEINVPIRHLSSLHANCQYRIPERNAVSRAQLLRNISDFGERIRILCKPLIQSGGGFVENEGHLRHPLKARDEAYEGGRDRKSPSIGKCWC
jgi:hypothetical protein